MRKSSLPRKPRRKGRNAKVKRAVMIFVTFVIIIGLFAVYATNRNLFPIVVEMTKMNVMAKMNAIAAESINSLTVERGLVSEDFYMKTEDGAGKIQSLSVNAVLINEICARLADDMSKGLNEMGREKIEVPIGTILGLDMLANIGPTYKVTVLPQGMASVDYESQFIAAGINQINFQVWLNLKTVAEIINPLKNTQITMERRVILVNTIITGEIPNTYFNVSPDGR